MTDKQIDEGWYWVRVRNERRWLPAEIAYSRVFGEMLARPNGYNAVALTTLAEIGPRLSPPDQE